MTTLTVTEQGEVTLREEVLQHLGIRPGDNVTLDLLPDGRAELRAEQPEHFWRDMAGFLDGKTNGAKLSIDEIGEAIAEAGAASGLSLLDAGGDFADGVIAHNGRSLGGDTFVSFDKRAVRLVAASGHAARALR